MFRLGNRPEAARPEPRARRRPCAMFARAVLVVALVALSLSAGGSYRLAAAQSDVMRIAAVVNDDVISIFDLAVRLAVAIRSSGFDDTPELRRQFAPQVLRAMVDERLQAQEARRLNVTASKEDIASAIASIEAQNKWEKGSFDKRIADAKLDRKAIVDRIATDIAWSKIVRRRFGTVASVSEEEVDAAAGRIEANRGKPENRVAEIFLPVDDPSQEAEVLRIAQNLVGQIQGGSSFPAVARQFSKGATASQGGEIGWVVAGQLAPDIEREVEALEPGRISDPIHSFDGYYIVTVIERRLALSGAADDPSFRLAQVVLESKPEDSLVTEAVINDLRQTHDCPSFLAAAQGRALPASGELGTIAVPDMPADLRAAITPLQAGQITPLLPYKDARRLIMVCERTQPEAAPQKVDRDAVRREIGNGKLDLASRRYLRDLRRAAFIEVRI